MSANPAKTTPRLAPYTWDGYVPEERHHPLETAEAVYERRARRK